MSDLWTLWKAKPVTRSLVVTVWMYAVLAVIGIGVAVLGSAAAFVLPRVGLWSTAMATGTIWAMRILFVCGVFFGAWVITSRVGINRAWLLSLVALLAFGAGAMVGARVEAALMDLDGAIALLVALLVYGAGVMSAALCMNPGAGGAAIGAGEQRVGAVGRRHA